MKILGISDKSHDVQDYNSLSQYYWFFQEQQTYSTSWQARHGDGNANCFETGLV